MADYFPPAYRCIITWKCYCSLYTKSNVILHANKSGLYCLPKGRHSEAAHGKRLLCAQKCTRGGVGWGWVMKGWGGVGHEGVGWGGSCRGGVGWVM